MTGPANEYRSPTRRPHNITTRFSDDELALVQAAAKRANVSLSEWYRRTVLTALEGSETGLILTLIHEDMQFLKIFMGTLFLPYLNGKTLTKEQTANVLLELKSAKISASKGEIIDAQNRKEK